MPDGKLNALHRDAALVVHQKVQGSVSEATALQIRTEIQPLVDRLEHLGREIDQVPDQLRTALMPLSEQMTYLRADLGSLPNAISREIAPILTVSQSMTGSLDEVLRVQRETIQLVVTELVGRATAQLSPIIASLSDPIESLTAAGQEVTESVAALQQLPATMDQQAKAARISGQKAVRALDLKLSEITQGLTRSWWILPAQTIGAGLVAGLLVMGGLIWLGTPGSSKQVPSAVERAWQEMRTQQTPEIQRWMDGFLAKHR
jgi:hypothetical protein